MPRTKKFADLMGPIRRDPVRRQRIEVIKQAMRDAQRLGALRAGQDVTQAEITDRLNVSQANISRIEHEDDLYLSTLRSYVEALGGELDVTARFPDGQVVKIA